jgi:PAS domain S-box-containing protein
MGSGLGSVKGESSAARIAARQPELEFILDAMPVLVASISSDLIYEFVNSAYEGWFGHNRSQIVGQSMLQVLGRQALDELRIHIDAALAGSMVTFETEVPYRFGGTRHILASYVPRRSDSGKVTGFVALVYDRTSEARSAATEALLARTSQQLSASLEYGRTLQTTVDLTIPQLADICMLHVPSSDLRSAALVAASHLSRAAEELLELDQSWPLAMDAPSGAAHVLRSGESELMPRVSEQCMRDEARSEEHFKRLGAIGIGSRICIPLRSRGRVVATLTLIRGEHSTPYAAEDLMLAEEFAQRASTALEHAELYRNARHAIRQREEFLSVASHELKTPLTTLQLRIQSLSVALQNQGAASLPQAAQSVSKMEQQVRRLTHLVDDLLDASRIAGAGSGLKLHAKPTDLVQLVRGAASRMADEAARKNSRIRLDVSGELVGDWDPTYLEHVVVNLLGNAIKFGNGQPIDVSVRPEGSDFAVLSVQDRGIGVAPEDQQRIFERFERAVSTTHYGGLGLGLWIALQIVESCGGTLHVESELGAGSTFTARLPRQQRGRE